MKPYYPDLEDHFPKLRRGHGFGTHKGPCAAEGCGRSASNHIDQGANIKDWQEERGVRLDRYRRLRKDAE